MARTRRGSHLDHRTGFRPCFLDVDDGVAVVVEDEPADEGRLVFARARAVGPASLVSSQWSPSSARVRPWPFLLSSGRRRMTRARWSTSVHSSVKTSPRRQPPEVREAARVLEVLDKVIDDAFVLVVFEETVPCIAFGELADVRLRSAPRSFASGAPSKGRLKRRRRAVIRYRHPRKSVSV